MKKSILSNPAFRYIFEIIVIVFSVSLSFYIQDILNEREKIELKNAALSGVLEDLESDKNSFSSGIRVNDIRISNIQKFLKKDISNDVISYLRRYYGFTGNDSNYRALVSTGSLEVIENKLLFKNINNYYMTNYKLLNQGANRDQELFMKFIDYTEKKYKIDSVSNFIENAFFKVNYGKNELRKMANDEVMRSQLINQMWLIREYNNFHKVALYRINKIDSLIRIEIN
tara:strand:+ start:382 stop:1065 length:684 start_codon:yes stop_codon:yes gene_type:complete